MDNKENLQLEESLIDIAIESFRFEGVLEKMLSKMEMSDRQKYFSQCTWFTKKVQKALDDAGIKLVSVAGQVYDPGMAVTPLNIDDFEPEDELTVIQMVEPIVMKDNALMRTGTVLLGGKK